MENITISKNKDTIQKDRGFNLLSKSYWAENRPRVTIEKSMDHSLCYSLLLNEVQVGFARVITYFTTTYYLCAVIIDENHRKKGLSKKLIDFIVHDDKILSLFGFLATKDAHGLYVQYGFNKADGRFMSKR